MCATTQPVWRLLANLGDVNPLDYGGYFVYRDETGTYPEEAELLCVDDESDENSSYTVYRWILDRCTFINGVLSDNRFHPDYPAWFADSLAAIASSAGMTVDELRVGLCSADPIARAWAYRAIGQHHGEENFDSYPLTLSRAEAKERYADQL